MKKVLVIGFTLIISACSQAGVPEMTQEKFEAQKEICILQERQKVRKSHEQQIKELVLMTKSDIKKYSSNICNIFGAIVSQKAEHGSSPQDATRKYDNYYKNIFSLDEYNNSDIDLYSLMVEERKALVAEIEEKTGQDAIKFVTSSF